MAYSHYYDENRPITHIDSKPSDPYDIEAAGIDSGVRKTLNTCQYWIKGLPGVCKHWSSGDPGECTFEETHRETKVRIYPSGWNGSRCDFLGRQYECNKYESTHEDLDEYICVAPCPQRSGLYKRDNEDEPWRAVRKSEIEGYNNANCDGQGFGRGSAGFSATGEEFEKLPVVCNYYRPFHMGFGAKKPKTSSLKHGKTRAEVDKETGRFVADERSSYTARLPFSFKVYNARAQLQKCAHWDYEEGSEFKLDEAGIPYLDGGDLCINDDELVEPYHKRSSSVPSNKFLKNVWSQAGGVVCNGARSDCPGYTGRWVYCVDSYMEKGDKIAAHQILELRFWMHRWQSVEEYDEVFRKPPNKSDPDTSDIYTYLRWETVGSTPADSVLLGKRCRLLIPASSEEFHPSMIASEELIYKKPGTAAPSASYATRGTTPSAQTSYKAGELGDFQVQYPNLVRDLTVFSNDAPDISDPDAGELYVKRSDSIDGDSIILIGSVIRNRSVYAFNATIAGYDGAPSLLRELSTSLPLDLDNSFGPSISEYNSEFVDFIASLDGKGELYESTSDNDGVYVIGPIDLEYAKLNELVVCFEYNGNWLFTKKEVWSQWHGGILVQKKFEHKYPEDQPYADDGYHIFTPPASALARPYTFSSSNDHGLYTREGSFFKCGTEVVYSTQSDFHYAYNWCLKKQWRRSEVTKWARVGDAGSLLVQIDDINLNYVFEWQATSAKAERYDEETDTIIRVKFDIVLPNDEYKQKYLRPNECLIKPKNGRKIGIFKSDDWKITVRYWYTEITNNIDVEDEEEEETTEDVVYPDFSTPLNRFSPGAWSFKLDENGDLLVENVINETMSIMVLFTDEEGRVISSFATKLIVEVARVFCKDVEIRYGWSADYQRLKLAPEKGFLRLDEDGPFRLLSAGSSYSGSAIPCGDHDIGWFTGIGPMWYPYNSCETTDFYDIWTGANSVVKPHEGTPRYDYRYMTPIENIPFCGSWATTFDCDSDWYCGYNNINTDSIRFTGYAAYRGYVNVLPYYQFGWATPKFGNVLREYVERFISMDQVSHISFAGKEPYTSSAWMPMAMDNSCFVYDFGSFDKETNNITFINQLNLLVSKTREEILYTIQRFRFDDVFGTRTAILASYPPPLTLISSSGFPFVSFYYFKDDEVFWAWQEKWKDIKRNNSSFSFTGSSFLSFLDIYRPDYLYDYYKKEHRFITDEGPNTVSFTAPDWDEKEGYLFRYPGISIGGDTRYFKCVYSSYDSADLVDWADEDNGFVSAFTLDSIYYLCTKPDSGWIHSEKDEFPDLYNMVFDSAATKEKDTAKGAGREIKMSYDAVLDETEEYLYNRGLTIRIPKNRLKYMPYEEVVLYDFPITVATYSEYPNIRVPNAAAAWRGVHDGVNIEFDFSSRAESVGWPCVCRVDISGLYGKASVRFEGQDNVRTYINQPNISVSENGGPQLAFRKGAVLSSSVIPEEASEYLIPWSQSIRLEIDPTRMLTRAGRTRRLNINVFPEMGSFALTDITLYTAYYIDGKEKIRTYERKYNVSRGDPGKYYNLDGPDRTLSYEFNRDNSGVYWFGHIAPQYDHEAHSKMRTVYASEQDTEDEEHLPAISDHDELLEAEAKQQELFEEAHALDDGGEHVFLGEVPPAWQSFSWKANAYIRSVYKAKIISETQGWENNLYSGDYEAYPTWSPRGFSYRWSSELRYARCYIIDTLHPIVQEEFIDVANNESKFAFSAVESYYAMRAWHQLLKTEKNLLIGGDAARQANEQQFRGFIDLVTGGGRP